MLTMSVVRHCDGLLTNKATNAGFQLYSTCREILVAAVPDSLPLANAAVLPISVSCAASALFVQLGVALPSLTPAPTGKRVLIWGGSSSVGSSAIQLAIAAGLEVVTTASSANHDFVRSLGASHIFDHKDPEVINKVLSVLKPDDLVVDCITNEDSRPKCAEILGRIGGGKLPLMGFPVGSFPENVEATMGRSSLSCPNASAELSPVNSLDPGLVNLDVGDAIWRKYLPEALAAGKYQAKPDPFVITGGLEKVQEGVDLVRKGVSAKKVVIELSKE